MNDNTPGVGTKYIFPFGSFSHITTEIKQFFLCVQLFNMLLVPFYGYFMKYSIWIFYVAMEEADWGKIQRCET